MTLFATKKMNSPADLLGDNAPATRSSLLIRLNQLKIDSAPNVMLKESLSQIAILAIDDQGESKVLRELGALMKSELERRHSQDIAERARKVAWIAAIAASASAIAAVH
jgi:hypothetical protein